MRASGAVVYLVYLSNLDDSVPEKRELLALQQELLDIYDKLSSKYHTDKVNNANNTLVLG